MKFTPSHAKQKWYISVRGETSGPFSIEELREKFKSPSLTTDTLVWKEGMADWQPIIRVPELASVSERLRPGSNTNSGIRLGVPRRYDTLNQLDTDAQAGINVVDLLADQKHVSGTPGQNLHDRTRASLNSKASQEKSSGFSMPHLSYETNVFLVSLILVGIACAIWQDYWHGVFFFAGILLCGIAWLDILYHAFQRGALWGFGCLIFPIVAIIFIIIELENTWRAVILYAVGLGVFYLTIADPNFEKSLFNQDFMEYQESH